MNNQDQVPTIAELWELFKMQINSAQTTETLANVQRAEKGKRAKVLAAKWDDLAKERHQLVDSLRQQLVECLDLITVGTPKKTRAYMLFGFTESNDEAISFIPRNDHDEEFKPTIEQCKELSAIFAFCGWELEQREKEASGD